MRRSVLKEQLSTESESHHQSSIQSVRRAMSLLKAFGPKQYELGVSELSRLTGLHKTTVYRLLVTLEEEGCIQHNPSNDKYRLGPTLIRLGSIVLHNIDIAQQSLPYMRTLTEETGETSMLEVWDGSRTLVVANVDGDRFGHMMARAGYHLPAHASSGGKAMLAFLTPEEIENVIALGLKQYTENTITDREQLLEELVRIRASRVAYDWQGIDIGVCAIGAPIFDHTGRIAGALSIAGPTQRIQMEADGSLTHLIKRTAETISRDLGYQFPR